jgi:hypothetical protein
MKKLLVFNPELESTWMQPEFTVDRALEQRGVKFLFGRSEKEPMQQVIYLSN